MLLNMVSCRPKFQEISAENVS